MDFAGLNFYLFSFLVVVVTTYLEKISSKITWLTIVSLFFILMWNWQSLAYALINSAFVFFMGQYLQQTSNKWKKFILILACGSQLAPLLLLRLFPVEELVHYEKSVLISGIVIGLSYYALQNISYLIDISRGNITSERRFLFCLFYTVYFPKFLLGPIENYEEFKVKVYAQKKCKDYTKPAYLIALGLFKRLVISNQILKLYADVESSYQTIHKPFAIFWTAGIMTYMIVYCDFSSYMNIGRGISLLLGIDLKENFNQPYFAKNPMDYWQRWHISLSTWMRNYVFYPILLKTKQMNIAILLTFVAVALWHGFRKELFIWALSWGFLQILYLFFGKKILNLFRFVPEKIVNVASVFVTFNLSALIGLFSLVLLFYSKELPDFKVFYDATTVLILKKHFIIFPALLILIIFETLDKTLRSPLAFYILLVVLVFLISVFMSTNSYLFYYMRL